MPITIATAGARLTVSKLSVLSGSLRRLQTAKVMVGGQLRTIASFAPPLSVSIAGMATGRGTSSRPATVRSNTVTAIPAGGFGPYRYAWVVDNPQISIAAPENASTSFFATVGSNQDVSGTATCTVTDASGTTSASAVNIYLYLYLINEDFR